MDEEIKKLLEQNLELTKEVYAMTKKIKNYITFQKVMSVFYILIIVVPVILSIIYLPPLLKNVFDQYKDLLGVQSGAGNPLENLLKGGAGNLNLDNVDINKLPANIRALIK
ncbi:MAG: hypothetical protein Q7R92_04185 [bacterium]|nr:hypothetical protein [bacterium]